MKRTIGWISGIIILVIILILAAYYGMGVATEYTLKKNLTTLDKTANLEVGIKEYERSWFKSKAVLDWKIHIPEKMMTGPAGISEIVPAQDYIISMPLIIHHGPIIIADGVIKFGFGYAQTTIPLPDQYVEVFKEKFTADSIQPKVVMSLFINYLNHSDFEFDVPAFKVTVKKDNSHMEWKGLETRLGVSSSGKKADGSISLEGIMFNNAEEKIALDRVESEYNLHKTDQGFFLGEANLAISSLVFENKGQIIFQLDNLKFDTSNDVQEKLFSTEFSVKLDKLITGDTSYGPGNLKLAIRNLDADTLAKFNDQAHRLQHASSKEKQQASLMMLAQLPKLLNRGAELEISTLNLKVPEGEIQGNLLISLPKTDKNQPFELFQLVQKAKGKAKLQMPISLMKQLLIESNRKKLTAINGVTPQTPINPQEVAAMADKQINQMLQSGLLVLKGNNYLFEASYENGQLMVNGKPFNSRMLQI